MWKRCLIMCLCLCLIGCAQAESYYTYGYICGESGVTIHEADSSDSRMLGCVFPGTPVTVIAHQGEWYWIHLDHLEQDGMLMGYVRAEQVAPQVENVQLPVVTLLGEEPVRMCSEDQHITRAMLEVGTELELLGQMDMYWLVRAGEQTGTIPLQAAEPDELARSMLNPDYLAQVQQDEEDRQAMNEYLQRTQTLYGMDSRAWPLEQRQEYARLQARCGIFQVWVDDLPDAGDLDQEAAQGMAVEHFREMWGIDADAEDWKIFTAFGYNQMEPHVRLWQFTFQENDVVDNAFLIQLTAETGELYRTSNTDTFAQKRSQYGHTLGEMLQNTLNTWCERLGRDSAEWTIEEQYAFAQTPIARLSHAYDDVTLPKDWEIPVEEALSTARLGLMHRYGLDAAELDALRLSTFAKEDFGERFYYFTWHTWTEADACWECLYTAQISMENGKIMNLSGPGEGNG